MPAADTPTRRLRTLGEPAQTHRGPSAATIGPAAQGTSMAGGFSPPHQAGLGFPLAVPLAPQSQFGRPPYISGRHDHCGSLPGKSLSRMEADARRCAGNDGEPVRLRRYISHSPFMLFVFHLSPCFRARANAFGNVSLTFTHWRWRASRSPAPVLACRYTPGRWSLCHSER